MRVKIINRRLLMFVQPGLSCFEPEVYTEKVIIPISKIVTVRLVSNSVWFTSVTKEDFRVTNSPEESVNLFNQVQSLLAETGSSTAEELK